MSHQATERQPSSSPELSDYQLAVGRLIDASTFDSMRQLLGQPDEYNRFAPDALAARREQRRELFEDVSITVQALGATMLVEQDGPQII